MCGIAGIAARGARDLEVLRTMAAELRHRGPDAEGYWSDGRVGLAFRRLSIIDLDKRSNQPLHHEQLHLVFNGEIYNYLELREELLALGHQFVTKGDGEVLLHAWAQWGESALDRLNGMFAFAIWEADAQRLTLAVDRFAEKPVFFHERDGRLAFASEVGALRVLGPGVAVPDRAAADRFLALGAMPALPATFFRDVRRLPPGHLARWEGGPIRLRRWWVPAVVEVPCETGEAVELLGGLLRDSVAIRLRSDVPVGTSLSGGIDSSAVVAICSELDGTRERQAFTATFPGFERDEWAHATVVAKAAGIHKHHPVCPDVHDLLSDLERLIRAQEEPFGSTSIYAQWQVMRAAREAGVVVMLDGQGADELFAGYLATRGWALRSRGPLVALNALFRDLSLLEPLLVAHTATRAPRTLAAWYRLRGASPYVSGPVARAAAAFDEPEPDWPASGSPLRRELLRQAFRGSVPDLCRFADRNSMAHSVEVRLPFLDHRLAEFVWSASADMLYRHGQTKWLLREAARELVPASILSRRDKVGYETPEARWLAAPAVRELIEAVLLDPSCQLDIDRPAIKQDLARWSWRDPHGIWRALNVELWLRQWR